MSVEKLNPGLETLVELGVVRPNLPGSAARDAIINCLGCRLAVPNAVNVSVSTQEVMLCSGLSTTSVRKELNRLERAGVLQSEGRGLMGGTAIEYFIADSTVGDAFAETVAPPQNCPILDNMQKS